jgi:simple sugar transport system permease protein
LFRKHSEIVILFIIMIVAFSVMSLLNPTRFMRLGNFQSMAFQMPELGILSLAMMITILSGGINLAIIATANLSGIITALILIHSITPEMGSGGVHDDLYQRTDHCHHPGLHALGIP